MLCVILLFAFTLSLVTNFIERLINPDNEVETEENENKESFVVEKSE